MNALATQAHESREIAEKKGWKIAEQYIESQTGTVAYKRKEYQRLMEDMEKDRFDIVMIKSIDRLTRSAKDWYFFLSRLTENRLRLYIYIEGKFYTPDDNLISGIKAILAEDFSRELSKKIKNAHRRRQQKRSGYNITCPMFGWNKIGKDCYEVNEEEAEYYRTAFALAREGKGFYTISNTLYDLGARGRRGQKISEVQWRKMLYAPRAHGTVILNRKVYNFDMKRYEEVPEEEWIIVENALPPIVSKEYQEEVISLMQKRAAGCRKTIVCGSKTSAGTGKYELSGKIKCAECGRPYYRTCFSSGKGKRVVWKCATFLENGRTGGNIHTRGCDNINLSEEKLLACAGEVLMNDELPKEEQELEDMMCILARAIRAQSGEKEVEKLEREYKKLTVRKEILLEKLLSGVIEDTDYEKHSAQIADKSRMIEAKIDGIKEKLRQYNNYEARMEDIRTVILKEGLIKKAAVKTLLKEIRQIEAHKDGRLLIYFHGEMDCPREILYKG